VCIPTSEGEAKNIAADAKTPWLCGSPTGQDSSETNRAETVRMVVHVVIGLDLLRQSRRARRRAKLRRMKK